jgi:uncharacterized membrane protein
MRITRARPFVPWAFIGTLTLALASVLAFIDWWRYAIFRNDIDLGLFTQVVASTGGRFSSTAEGGANHLLTHWSPIVAAMWPLVRWFGPIGLQFGQACLAAATLVPVWALARARLGNRMAAILATIAALYPLLWANGVGDFHEMAFVPLLSATLVYAIDRRRWPLASVAVALLLCTKEDQFWILGCIGAMIALTARKDRDLRLFGSIVLLLAIAAAALYFGVVRHVLDPTAAYGSLKFFDWRPGAGVGSAPVFALIAVRATYALIVLAPLAFLPCASRYGLFLIPGAIEIMASHLGVTLAPGAHYSALLTGYALCGFVDGFSRVRTWNWSAATAAAGAAAALSIGVQLFASPMEYWYYLYRLPNAHDALLERTLRALPHDAHVGTEGAIFAHLGLNPRAVAVFYWQPWFVYDAKQFSVRWKYVDEPILRRLIDKHEYTVFERVDGIVVLRRTRP